MYTGMKSVVGSFLMCQSLLSLHRASVFTNDDARFCHCIDVRLRCWWFSISVFNVRV